MRWIWLAPVGALAYAIIALWEMIADAGPLFAPLLLVVFGVLAALCAGAFLLVALAVRRRRPGRAMIAFALTIGFQAATPVEVGWHDGCNEHGGEIAAIGVPYIWLAEPELSYAPYSDASTSMGCP